MPTIKDDLVVEGYIEYAEVAYAPDPPASGCVRQYTEVVYGDSSSILEITHKLLFEDGEEAILATKLIS